MSNEGDSLRALADSNHALAESNIKLAASFDRYADTLERYAGKVVSLATGEDIGTTAAPEKPKAAEAEKPKAGRGRPKKEDAPPPAADANDGFGDDGFGDEGNEATPALDFDAVKAKLFEVRDKFGDKGKALEIIGKFGYKALPEIQEKDFGKIYAEAEKMLK